MFRARCEDNRGLSFVYTSMGEGPLFHLKHGKRFKAKELFKDISRIIQTHFGDKTNRLNILDVGCASGELLYYLKRHFETSGKLCGFDIEKQLVKSAKERFGDSSIRFFVADARTFTVPATFDVITMTSVLSYFDDPYPVLRTVLRHLNEGGILIISGIFNPWNIDVRLNYKLPDEKRWNRGNVINQCSKKSISEFLMKAGYSYAFSTQVMPFPLAPTKKNPIRSWTVSLDGRRYMMNGLQLAYNIELLQITQTRKYYEDRS